MLVGYIAGAVGALPVDLFGKTVFPSIIKPLGKLLEQS